jgi:hypothetical protein
MRLWSIRPRPKPHELLSSWLVRIARRHSVKLHSFCCFAFGRQKQIWNRDIDKKGDDEVELIVRNRTATADRDVRRTVLRRFEGIVFERINPLGNTAFITPLGIYHRVHRAFGLQFCPQCLAANPYFRVEWRLSVYVFCPRHRALLHDRCSNCGRPVNFHRGELGHKGTSRGRAMHRCWYCNYDLRTVRSLRLAPQMRSLLADVGTKYDHALKSGVVRLPSGNVTYSHLYFAVVRHLMVVCGRRRNLQPLVAAAAQDLGFDRRIMLHSRSVLEYESVTVRAAKLAVAEWLLRGWPERTIGLCRTHHVWSSSLLSHFDPCPYWFWHIIKTELYCVYTPWRKHWSVGKKELRSYTEFGMRHWRSTN